MSEKYIDLAGDIASTYRIDRGVTDFVLNALDRFLADHPDQVPGRTITASELRERSHYMTDNERVTFMEGVSVAGGRVVPDPELTNVEILESKLRAFALEVCASETQLETARSSAPELAAWLDEHGVRAGGDDDQ